MAEFALRSARFQLLRELGHGGMGVVYEAYDHETDSFVALKTLKTLDGEALYRLKNEFRALADLQHPNLVHLRELYCEHNQWFFTMELVEGQDFLQHVRPGHGDLDARALRGDDVRTVKLHGIDARSADGAAVAADEVRRYDEARLRSAAGQLAGAIVALHRARRVHRDIKPANVLVREDGHLVLLDFGLVDEMITDGEDPDRRGVIIGTPQFMAPEQAQTARVGPEADWYAFGVMLFLALTGKLPFTGTPEQIVSAKCSRVAPSPRAVLADVPADLDEICQQLLARDPAARPGADEILARLGVAAPPADHRRAARAVAASDVFVGRERELEQLRKALADCRAGGGASVLIHGDAGVGKSALVRHFIDAELKLDSSAVILSGRCYEQESVPFKGFDSIIDALSLYLSCIDEDVAAALLRSGFRFLSTVFPVLQRVPLIGRQTPGTPIVDNALASRQQAFQELKRLLSALAESHTLIVFVDDLQWADKDSLALLQALFSSPDATPGLFIATVRAASETALQQPLDLPHLATRLQSFRLIALDGLSPDDSRVLWTTLRGRSAHERHDSDARWLQESGGHPLFLSELARYAGGAPHRQPRTASLRDVLWNRIEQLDAPARRLMELVGLAGFPIRYQALARAADVELATCLYQLSSLRTEQMVRMSRRGDARLVEPYHDRVREAIVERLHEGQAAPSPEIRRRHLRLGWALLDATTESELPLEVFGIVKHLGMAADLIDDVAARRRVAELYVVAGRQAKLATAYEPAIAHFDRGISLLDDEPWAACYSLCRTLHVERMEAEYLAGHVERATQHFAELLERMQTDEELTDLYVSKIALDAARACSADAIASAREGLAQFGVALPKRATTAHVMAELLAVRLAQGLRRVPDIAHLPELTDVRRRCALRLLIAVTPSTYFQSRELMAFSIMRSVRISLEHGISEETPYALAAYGSVLAGALDQFEEGDAFGRVALRLSRRFRPERFMAKLNVVKGLFLTGWVRPAVEATVFLRQAADAAARHGDIEYEAYAMAGLTFVPYYIGAPLAELQAQAESSHATNVRRQQVDMIGVTESLVRYCAALRGTGPDPRSLTSASASADDLRATLDDRNTPIALFFYNYLTAELAYVAGEYDRAELFMREARRRVDRVFALPVNADFMLLTVLVAAQRNRHGSARERLEHTWTVTRALRKLRRMAYACPENFESHYLLAAAERARVRGSHDEAGELYRKALRSAMEHGSGKREALTLELTARFLDERAAGAQATRCREQARDAYRRWGAEPKARALT